MITVGADKHIDYGAQPFESVISNIDIVLNGSGKEYVDRSLEVIKKDGTLILIPFGLDKTVTEKVKAKHRNSYPLLVQSNTNDRKQITDLLAKKIIVPHISQVYFFLQMPRSPSTD